jgi:NADH-quinone oxidoreductase subunit K
MADIPMQYTLSLAAILFLIGLTGLLVRRNVLFMLMSVEIMLNAAGLAFIAGSFRWAQADGQVMFIFILTMAATEVAVGLALILQFNKHYHTLDADAANTMKG